MRYACALVLSALVAACGGSLPDTRYYTPAGIDLSLDDPSVPPTRGGPVLVIETLATDAAYDDDRIVYRQEPHRLDYYYYHRWTAPPGIMVADYLRQAYQRTGRFRTVSSQAAEDADVILGGRVVALEEVDVTEEQWLARLVLDLHLRDARTGETLWARTLHLRRPMPRRHPEGLAQALGTLLARVVDETAPILVTEAARARTPAARADIAPR